MNKIGILTFHNANNYGAVLQAYALQTALRKVTSSHNIEVIDYHNEKIEKTKKVFLVVGSYTPKNVLAAFCNMKGRKAKVKKIGLFIAKKISLSQSVNKQTISQIKGEYEKVIVGSDQVWNYDLTGNDSEYFLPGPYNEKYSYAASMGNYSSIGMQQKSLLGDFTKVSVREKSTSNLLKSIANIDSIVVCDPTMLLDANEWDKIISKRKYKEKYILVYSINPNINLMAFAKKIAKENNMKLVYISMNALDRLHIKNVCFEKNPSPEEFISLIKNADVVLTNSFHGTVFSIIYKKSFWVETDYATFKNDRINDLLNYLGLESRIVQDKGNNQKNEINWNCVDEKMSLMQTRSMHFLNEVVNS